MIINLIKDDIFADNNKNTVIPVNEYFDVHVGDGIICERSIHGQFIKRFNGSIQELKSKIYSSLDGVKYETVVRGEHCCTRRYDIGTIAKVNIENKTYLLLATTVFDEENHVVYSPLNHMKALAGLASYVQQNINGGEITLPLIGTGRGGELSAVNSLQTILNAFSITPDIKKETTLSIIHQCKKWEENKLVSIIVNYSDNCQLNIRR